MRVYLPFDYIYRSGDEGDEMYFITEGRVGSLSEDEL